MCDIPGPVSIVVSTPLPTWDLQPGGETQTTQAKDWYSREWGQGNKHGCQGCVGQVERGKESLPVEAREGLASE